MYVNAKSTPEGTRIQVLTLDGEKIGGVVEADTDKGWMAMYAMELLGNGKTRVITTRAEVGYGYEPVIVRVYRPFKLVDRTTGEILAQTQS